MSGKVTHNITLETAKRSSATICEKEGFIECYNQAKDIFVLRSVTTDGNLMVKAYMKNENDVIHGLDVWHLCKNLSKNLSKKATSAVSAFGAQSCSIHPNHQSCFDTPPYCRLNKV